MGDHKSYEESIKGVYFGLGLLAVVTLVEVGFSLFGKGHILGGTGLHEMPVTVYIIGLLLIGLSIYKAYFIIFEFMHMGYEVKGLAMSVLLPVILLVWAIIAFFMEGDYWKDNRDRVRELNERSLEQSSEESTSDVLDLYEALNKG